MTAGIASQRYCPDHTMIAAVNGAVVAFGTMFAREIGPKRINVVSPGVTHTPTFDSMPKEKRDVIFKTVAEFLPVKYVAQPEDIARAFIYLMENTYHTGDNISPDGGYRNSAAP